MSKLNRMPWLQLCLVAMVALVAWGCDDDEPAEETDTTTMTDTTTGGDTSTGDATDTTTGEDTTTNPDTVGVDTEGQDTNMPDTMMGTEVPIDWPADPQGYVDSATTVTYLNTLTMPTVENGVPSCCKDFGTSSRDFVEEATNNVDNALAKLAASLSTFDLDLQATLDEQLQSGTFALLFDHREFSGMATDDDNFVLAGLLGEFDAAAGTTYTEANAGTGSFVVNPSSFPNGDGVPLISFNPAMMNGGALSAGPSEFILSLPIGVANLDVTVSETELLATGAIDGNGGVSYSGGTLAGYVLVSDIVDALNGLVTSDTCACLGISSDIYTYDETTGRITAECLDQAEVDANCAGETVCIALGGGKGPDLPLAPCGAIGDLIAGQADIDVNGDCDTDPDNCNFDALSLGLQWTGVPATVTGLTP